MKEPSPKRQPTVQEEEDSNIYEQIGSDEDYYYDDVNNYVEYIQEGEVTVEDNREEEEDKFSDDENDYKNVG